MDGVPTAAAPPRQYHRFGEGRPRVPDRRCADVIFYVLRTGCQWQALDQIDLCAHSTAHDRIQLWAEAGVVLQLWQAGVEQFDELCGISFPITVPFLLNSQS